MRSRAKRMAFPTEVHEPPSGGHSHLLYPLAHVDRWDIDLPSFRVIDHAVPILSPKGAWQVTAPSSVGKTPRRDRPVASNPVVEVIRAANGFA